MQRHLALAQRRAMLPTACCQDVLITPEGGRVSASSPPRPTPQHPATVDLLSAYVDRHFLDISQKRNRALCAQMSDPLAGLQVGVQVPPVKASSPRTRPRCHVCKGSSSSWPQLGALSASTPRDHFHSRLTQWL